MQHFRAAVLALVVLYSAGVHAARFDIEIGCSKAGTCMSAVQNALSGCARHSDCEVVFGAGSYVIDMQHPQQFVLPRLRNVVIRGQSANATTLTFTGLAMFFAVVESRNVTFTDFSVDMVRVPFTVGTVVASNATASILSVDDTDLYPIDPATQKRFTYLDRAQAVIGYRPDEERFQLPDIYTLDKPFSIRYSGNQMILGHGGQTVGETLVVRHQVYVFNAFSASNSQQLVWRNVVLLGTGGMGILTNNCTDIDLDGYQTQRKRFPNGKVRAMSITADGIHIMNSRGGTVRVQNCILEGQGDDGANINTEFGRITWMSPDRRAVNLTGYMDVPVCASRYVAGDTAEVFSGQTLLPAGVSSPITKASPSTMWFRDPLPPSVALYDLMVNPAAAADSTVVAGNQFLRNRARGLLIKQPNSLVHHNAFDGMTSPAILTEIDGCFWMEGRPLYNVTIRENSIRQPDGFGPTTIVHIDGHVAKYAEGKPTTKCLSIKKPGVFKRIHVLNNSVAGTHGAAEKFITVHGTTGGDVSGNTMIGEAGGQHGLPNIQLVGTERIVTAGNKCKDFSRKAYTCDIVRN